MNIPKINIKNGLFHWKVGDGMDVNGGEDIAQMALVFLDQTHFQVRFYNPSGREIYCTPGIVDVEVIEENCGHIPEIEDLEVTTIPKSRRTRAPNS